MLLVIGRWKTCPRSMLPAIFMTNPGRANRLPTPRAQVKGCTFDQASHGLQRYPKVSNARTHILTSIISGLLAHDAHAVWLVFVIFGIHPVNRLDITGGSSLGVKGIGQKGIGNIFGQLRSNHPGAHGDDLRVV